MAPVKNLKILARQAVVAPPASYGSVRPMGRDEDKMNRNELITRLFKEVPDRMDSDRDSLNVERVALNPVVDGPRNRSEVRYTMEYAFN